MVGIHSDVDGDDDVTTGDDLPALKIVFFVLVDGWYLIAGSLIKSFDTSLPLPDPQ